MMMRSLLWITVMSLMACEGCERSEPVVDDRGGTVDAGGLTDAGVMDGDLPTPGVAGSGGCPVPSSRPMKTPTVTV